MKFEKLKSICSSLNIGSGYFWQFIKEKIHSYPMEADGFPWACFPITDDNNTLIDISLVVPIIVDEATLLVNIHELAHAYELFGLLGQTCEYQEKKSEEYARGKEELYLNLIKPKN